MRAEKDLSKCVNLKKKNKKLFSLLEKLKGEKILNTEKEILTHWPHSSVSIFPKRSMIWFSG